MSATLNTSKSSFVVYGQGHNDTRADSGNGDKVSGVWYDKDGNMYEFPMLKGAITLNAGQRVGNETDYVAQGDSVNEMACGYNANNNNYGATNFGWLKTNDYNIFDYMEDDIWLTPFYLPTLSVGNLMDLGLLDRDTPSSVRMYKNEPLSQTFVEISVTVIAKHYIYNPSGLASVYSDVDIDSLGATFAFYDNGYLWSQNWTINDLDMGICEVTKKDGTVGFGICLKGAYYTPGTLFCNLRIKTNDNIFNKLNVFGA